MKNIFKVKNFSYQYPQTEKKQLTDLNFNISKGEVLGIFGKSGCGKTTLLHCLSGFIPHFFKGGKYQGEIEFLNKKIANYSLTELTKLQGVVFQNPSTQLFGLTVEDALAFGLENINLSKQKIDQRINKTLKKLNISHLKSRQTFNLSGGEKQLVAIASMLVMKPKAIIFDETISALDQKAQSKIRSLLTDLKKQGMTMILIDTDLDWLSQVSDQILVLDQSKQIYHGPTNALDNNPELLNKTGLRTEKSLDFQPIKNSQKLIELNSVCYRYRKRLAVNNISGIIERGTCLGLIGHNGSGKTTLTKVLAGIYQPEKGQVFIQGEDIHQLETKKKIQKVGYLYQIPATMFIKPTVEQELKFSYNELGIGQKVKLNQLDLNCFESASPHELSAGQQQRLGLGCLLSTDPNILILDEPTLGQTQKDREKLRQLIFKLQSKDKTIILISHDWRLVAQSTNNLWVMNQGQIIKKGATKKIMQNKQFFNNLNLPLPW
jgi:energy-coupling factor transport system ATP-binding protein